MSIVDSIAKRRTYYQLDKDLPVAEQEVVALVEKITELVPDAFNMKSARAVVVTGSRQDALWDAIYDAFGGKVAREKIDGFRAAYGTILYFYDTDVVKGLQERFPLYAANFPVWPSRPTACCSSPSGAGCATSGLAQTSSITIRSSMRWSGRCSTCWLPGSSSLRCRSAGSWLSRMPRRRRTSGNASASSAEPVRVP